MWKVAATGSLTIALVLVTLNAAQPPLPYCVADQQQEDHIHQMMSESLDQAFREHINHLWDIWVKDQAEEPTRAVNGARIGINAYVRAQRNLKSWKAPRCKEQ
jgi:hypothetical protein